MKTLIIDNYDSFTYNLYQYIAELGGNPVVYRNDERTIDAIAAEHFTHCIISPGPGNPSTPRDIGISRELITFAAEKRMPLLGVCLGHQTLAVHFGGTVERAKEIFHGRSSVVTFIAPRSVLFRELPATIEVMRYHSLCVTSMPAHFRITAQTDDGIVMGMEHETLPLYGVQFHPESIGTPQGKDILSQFLSSPER